MASALLVAKASPSKALLIARLHSFYPTAMDASRFSSRPLQLSKSAQGLGFAGRYSAFSCQRKWMVQSGGSPSQRCFCSSSGSQHQAGSNTSNVAPAHQQQQAAGSFTAHPQHASHGGSNNPGPQQLNTSAASRSSGTSPVAGVSSPPRTSAAAEVIDKYLGPSTLKLERRDEKPSPPPPPPPPRRNYGPQGTQEKKSGKDLVAESAACAVIEKYLGPWPGFPPRDPKIDEYLDSLPENAACAAIDKYFGPYKPLFVFKKNEENANSPPPPSRPPRNRMTSRARNRAWNASQQGVSVERPWTAPPQQGSAVKAMQGGQDAPTAGASGSQGVASVSSSQSTSQQGDDGRSPQPSVAQPPSCGMGSQSGGGHLNQHSPPQQGATTAPPSHMHVPCSGVGNQ